MAQVMRSQVPRNIQQRLEKERHMRVVLTTRQIGHYHDARYRGAAACINDLTVISVANEGGFSEFLARDTGSYAIERLYPDRVRYDAAVASGQVGAAMAEKLDQLSPDVVAVAGWATPESFAAIAWARRNRRGLVMMSESQAFDASRSHLREAMKARIVSLCHAGLVGGPTHRDYMARLGLDHDHIFFGYNAVGNDHFAAHAAIARADAAKKRADLGLPERYILASARFIEKKNLPGLIRAYAEAREAHNEAPELIILGDGPTRADVEQSVAACGLAEHVHLPGFRGYDVLPAYYALAHGFAHVSLVEQWGLVVNEAMASGTPVVVSKPCGAAQALIEDGVNGFLVDPDDINDMANGLRRLFALDAIAHRAMREVAEQTIANWGPARFGDGLLAAARKALAASARSGLRPWDSALLSYISRRNINKVA
jgi:glycosyltransferase involved in cell wall biosynthesis